MYMDTTPVTKENREAVRAIYRGDHEHSSDPEKNGKYKVIVCEDNLHMAVSFLGCCVEKAQEYAEGFFARNLAMSVDVVEVWDEFDISHGEPGTVFYPDNHRVCPEIRHTTKCDDLGLYCHDLNTDIKIGVK